MNSNSSQQKLPRVNYRTISPKIFSSLRKHVDNLLPQEKYVIVTFNAFEFNTVLSENQLPDSLPSHFIVPSITFLLAQKFFVLGSIFFRKSYHLREPKKFGQDIADCMRLYIMALHHANLRVIATVSAPNVFFQDALSELAKRDYLFSRNYLTYTVGPIKKIVHIYDPDSVSDSFCKWFIHHNLNFQMKGKLMTSCKEEISVIFDLWRKPKEEKDSIKPDIDYSTITKTLFNTDTNKEIVTLIRDGKIIPGGTTVFINNFAKVYRIFFSNEALNPSEFYNTFQHVVFIKSIHRMKKVAKRDIKSNINFLNNLPEPTTKQNNKAVDSSKNKSNKNIKKKKRNAKLLDKNQENKNPSTNLLNNVIPKRNDKNINLKSNIPYMEYKGDISTIINQKLKDLSLNDEINESKTVYNDESISSNEEYKLNNLKICNNGAIETKDIEKSNDACIKNNLDNEKKCDMSEREPPVNMIKIRDYLTRTEIQNLILSDKNFSDTLKIMWNMFSNLCLPDTEDKPKFNFKTNDIITKSDFVIDIEKTDPVESLVDSNKYVTNNSKELIDQNSDSKELIDIPFKDNLYTDQNLSLNESTETASEGSSMVLCEDSLSTEIHDHFYEKSMNPTFISDNSDTDDGLGDKINDIILLLGDDDKPYKNPDNMHIYEPEAMDWEPEENCSKNVTVISKEISDKNGDTSCKKNSISSNNKDSVQKDDHCWARNSIKCENEDHGIEMKTFNQSRPYPTENFDDNSPKKYSNDVRVDTFTIQEINSMWISNLQGVNELYQDLRLKNIYSWDTVVLRTKHIRNLLDFIQRNGNNFESYQQMTEGCQPISVRQCFDALLPCGSVLLLER